MDRETLAAAGTAAAMLVKPGTVHVTTALLELTAAATAVVCVMTKLGLA